MYLVAQARIERATQGFSVRHTDRVCHLPIYKTQKEKIVGFEPTTFCLADKCSTNELNIFLKEKIAVCVFNLLGLISHRGWLRRQDSNLRFLTYEDSEIGLFSTPQWWRYLQITENFLVCAQGVLSLHHIARSIYI